MSEVQWVFVIAFASGLFGHLAIFRILLAVAKRTKGPLDEAVVKHLYRPAQWAAVVLVVRIIIQTIAPDETLAVEKHILGLLLIGTISALVIKLTSLFEAFLLARFDVGAKDNLKARKIYTQFRVLKRIITAIVCILALSMILMTFDKLRQLGTTILASAGIIGLVVGMAAQKTIGTFIAGLQIAFTQPVRIDDVVIVENEWGRIEEIALTYVVVKIWDQRRLIVPITYFIEKPFQNWTRSTADILGTVYIYVDYSVPVDAVRQKLQELLNESELWDKKVCVLQVTNTTEKVVELRALMSAADASLAWELRCHIREKLVEFLRDKYPSALPKIRAELQQKT